jgi:hypothetical protein
VKNLFVTQTSLGTTHFAYFYLFILFFYCIVYTHMCIHYLGHLLPPFLFLDYTLPEPFSCIYSRSNSFLPACIPHATKDSQHWEELCGSRDFWRKSTEFQRLQWDYVILMQILDGVHEKGSYHLFILQIKHIVHIKIWRTISRGFSRSHLIILTFSSVWFLLLGL